MVSLPAVTEDSVSGQYVVYRVTTPSTVVVTIDSRAGDKVVEQTWLEHEVMVTNVVVKLVAVAVSTSREEESSKDSDNGSNGSAELPDGSAEPADEPDGSVEDVISGGAVAEEPTGSSVLRGASKMRVESNCL